MGFAEKSPISIKRRPKMSQRRERGRLSKKSGLTSQLSNKSIFCAVNFHEGVQKCMGGKNIENRTLGKSWDVLHLCEAKK